MKQAIHSLLFISIAILANKNSTADKIPSQITPRVGSYYGGGLVFYESHDKYTGWTARFGNCFRRCQQSITELGSLGQNEVNTPFES